MKRTQKPKQSVIRLSSEDLQEFTLRRATLNAARFHFLMVEEAFLVWSKNIRTQYAVPTVKFEINPQTGVVTPQEN